MTTTTAGVARPLRATALRSNDRVEDLVRNYLTLVEQVVCRVAARFPRHVERAELVSAGALGLVEAAQRYDEALGVPFDRYAAIRIRGAILDSTRSRDWVSRSVRRQSRELVEAESELTARSGRRPEAAEIAGSLGIAEAEVTARRARAAESMLLSLDYEAEGSPATHERLIEQDRDALPDAALAHREAVGTLRQAIAELPGNHGEVVRRYYYGGELLQEIAADLGVTEARISQINSEAIATLRRFFATIYEGVPEVDERTPGKRSRAAYLERLTRESSWKSRMAAVDAPLETRKRVAVSV